MPWKNHNIWLETTPTSLICGKIRSEAASSNQSENIGTSRDPVQLIQLTRVRCDRIPLCCWLVPPVSLPPVSRARIAARSLWDHRWFCRAVAWQTWLQPIALRLYILYTRVGISIYVLVLVHVFFMYLLKCLFEYIFFYFLKI